MTNWRPEGWENPAKNLPSSLFPVEDAYLTELKKWVWGYYEAGADAMLEALKKRGIATGGGLRYPLVAPPHCTVVFIPDNPPPLDD